MLRPVSATEAAFEDVSVISFKDVQAGVEQLALRDDDDVEAWRELVATENLSNQSFRSIPDDRAAQFPGRRDAEPADAGRVRQDEHRAVTAVGAGAPFVDLLELGAPADPFGGAKPRVAYSLLTVRRLRPFARRRFNTRRPFLVLMRTRNPCVRLRCRVLG
jgi:hypothetical protein